MNVCQIASEMRLSADDQPVGGNNGRSATTGNACLTKNADRLGSAVSLAEELAYWDGTKKR